MLISVIKTFAAVSGCPCSPVTRPVITACCASALPEDSARAAAIANDPSVLRGRRTGLIGPLTREKCPTAELKHPPTAPKPRVPFAKLQNGASSRRQTRVMETATAELSGQREDAAGDPT